MDLKFCDYLLEEIPHNRAQVATAGCDALGRILFYIGNHEYGTRRLPDHILGDTAH
jgi:hypothetical protein